MPTGNPAGLRDRILDAAEAVVLRQGIANLTLEAVASRAGLSKGGLLHHFPTKDRLVEGLVTRCADEWLEAVEEAGERAAPGPGRLARAMLERLGDAGAWSEQCQHRSSAAFAALAQDPRLIAPIRAVYVELRRRMERDGLPEGVGEVILLTMDGLWLNRVLGLAPVDQDRLDRIRAALRGLLASVGPKGSAGRRRSRPGRVRVGKRGRR
jgi:AcrR family transcriptional regulator